MGNSGSQQRDRPMDEAVCRRPEPAFARIDSGNGIVPPRRSGTSSPAASFNQACDRKKGFSGTLSPSRQETASVDAATCAYNREPRRANKPFTPPQASRPKVGSARAKQPNVVSQVAAYADDKARSGPINWHSASTHALAVASAQLVAGTRHVDPAAQFSRAQQKAQRVVGTVAGTIKRSLPRPGALKAIPPPQTLKITSFRDTYDENEQADEIKVDFLQNLERARDFWFSAANIYAGYKMTQAKVHIHRLVNNFKSDSGKSFERRKLQLEEENIWEEQHQKAARDVHKMCSRLGGFYIKSAQFLAKPDLVPKAWVKELSHLYDNGPATPLPMIRQVISRELNLPPEEIFAEFSEKPVGSASIGQVHRAKLRITGKDVAVKVQHPTAEKLMMQDIRNQKALAGVLQRFEPPFDFLSLLNELEEQVAQEFDFRKEATSMKQIRMALNPPQQVVERASWLRSTARRSVTAMAGKTGMGMVVPRKQPITAALAKPPMEVVVPEPVEGLVTKRVLVMDFLDGIPLTKLEEEMQKRGIPSKGIRARHFKKKILESIGHAYGTMILRDGLFQADPHPGNFIIMDGPKIGLIDFGQTKRLPLHLRQGFGRLVTSMKAGDHQKVAENFLGLGVEMKEPVEDPKSMQQLSRMVSNMFDSHGKRLDAFSPDSMLKTNGVGYFPSDLVFVLRTSQLLRGISCGMNVRYSTVNAWANIANAPEVVEAPVPEMLKVPVVPLALKGFESDDDLPFVKETETRKALYRRTNRRLYGDGSSEDKRSAVEMKRHGKENVPTTRKETKVTDKWTPTFRHEHRHHTGFRSSQLRTSKQLHGMGQMCNV